MTPLVDAHAHLGTKQERLARKNVFTVYCGTDPESAREVLALQDSMNWVSCALHPWHAEEYSVEDMLPYIKKCPVLGEIGLDSVWTEADMDAQRKVFVCQLELAEALQKPVVLHTKGMEEEIARTLRNYSGRKLVHWYSCMEHLDDYLAQDCYFTVGPDHANNPAVAQVLERVPLSRLLTETDGMGAVSWALGREVDPTEVENVLEGELEAIAAVKGISLFEAREQVYRNLLRFVG